MMPQMTIDYTIDTSLEHYATVPETISLISSSQTSSQEASTFLYGLDIPEDEELSLSSHHDNNANNKEDYLPSRGDPHGADAAKRKRVTFAVQQHKSIGMLGSIAIAVNSLSGPAILQLPFQYQESGIIPTTICLVVVGILSSFCCLHMADTVSQVPGNRQFDKRIEFSDCFAIFWNKKSYAITQVLFFLCATCLNVAAIVDTAEVVDSFLGFHYKTLGWSAETKEWQTWSHAPCSRNNSNSSNNSKVMNQQQQQGSGGGGGSQICEPFGEEDIYGDYLLSAGYIITAAVFVPICLMDLKENTAWQIFGFALLCSLSAYFCYDFSGYQLTFDNITLWGFQWSDMLGVILFNFTLVMTMPSWLHEKKDSVSVKTVVYGSTAISTALYIAVGILGAFAIPHVKVNMLQPMMSGAYGTGLQLSGSLFAFFIIGLDIPLFSVLCRYNLMHSGLCSDFMANILVVWIPWLGSWLFYQGDAVGELLQWGGVLSTSTLAFVLPLYIALRALVTTDQVGSIHVYGVGTSRRMQMICLYVLLFVASFAVALAIGGQVSADRERGTVETTWRATNNNNLEMKHYTKHHHHISDMKEDVGKTGDGGYTKYHSDHDHEHKRKEDKELYFRGGHNIVPVNHVVTPSPKKSATTPQVKDPVVDKPLPKDTATAALAADRGDTLAQSSVPALPSEDPSIASPPNL